MSPAWDGERGLTQVEIEAVVERLKSIDDRLKRIEDSSLSQVHQYMQAMDKRISEAEKWQAGVEPMIDSINERLSDATDMCEEARTWISEQKGWNSGRTQMIVQIAMLIGMAVTLIKIVFFKS